MSEIRDKVILNLDGILMKLMDDIWVKPAQERHGAKKEALYGILSIPELAIVDREAELPQTFISPFRLKIKGWVKEVKEARVCTRCGAPRTDNIDSDICGSCADALRMEK